VNKFVEIEEIKVGAGIAKVVNKEILDENKEAENDIMFECPEGCGRTFNARALDKHVKVCRKLFSNNNKKKSKEERNANEANEKEEKKRKWKEQSEQLRQVMQNMKNKQDNTNPLNSNNNTKKDSLPKCDYC
jgi:hypothetical protein